MDSKSPIKPEKKAVLIAHCIQRLESPSKVVGAANSVKYNPHKPHELAIGSDRSYVKIYDLEQQTEKMLPIYSQNRPAVSKFGTVYPSKSTSVAYNSHHPQLATGLHGSKIHLWDSRDYKSRTELIDNESNSDIIDLSYNNDGSHLLSCAYDKQMKLWDLQTGQCVCRYPNESEDSLFLSIACNPTNPNIVAASLTGGTIRLIDIRSFQPITTLQPTDKKNLFFGGIAYHPQGTKLASIACTGEVHEWDLASQNFLRSEKELNSGHSVAYHHNGEEFATGSLNYVTRREVSSTKPYYYCEGAALSVDYNHDGTQLASGFAWGVVALWNLQLIKKIENDDFEPEDLKLLKKLAHKLRHKELFKAEKEERLTSMGFTIPKDLIK
jgi:WD40 repeat protein